jgi:glycosyltransferase involved in cell wall biosynthesis
VVIENGLDVPVEPVRDRVDGGVLIVGMKNPLLALRVRERLQAGAVPRRRGVVERLVGRGGPRIEVLTRLVPRPAFLEALRRARVAVFLPSPTEGFYLPALEAMAVGALVVCPDVVGNRLFCLSGENCFRPAYTLDEIAAASAAAVALSPVARAAILERARETARAHDLGAERASFLEVLRDVEAMW